MLLSDLTSRLLGRATVRSIDTAAVCEATGDAQLKSIFQTPPSPFSLTLLSTSRLHLSLYVNHRSLSEASSQAVFKHTEVRTFFSLSPLPLPSISLLSTYHLSRSPSPPYLAIHPFTSFFPSHVAPFAFSLPLSLLPLSVCNCRWSY